MSRIFFIVAAAVLTAYLPGCATSHRATAQPAAVSLQRSSLPLAKAGRPAEGFEQASASDIVVPQPIQNADLLPSQLLQRAADRPTDAAAQLDAQLFRLLTNEPVPNRHALWQLSVEDRELLAALLDSLSRFRDQIQSPQSQAYTKKIQPLLELSDRLRSRADLVVGTVAICRKVKSFGVYDPMDPARFAAGQDLNVVVYCEIENFFSRLNARNLYETRLAEKISLLDESGHQVWSDLRSTYVDQSFRQRRDFFIGKLIEIPKSVSAGTYALRVSIEDLQSHHSANNSTTIELTPP